MALFGGLGTSLVVTTLAVAFGPPVVSFGLAAAAAAGWCAWLDRHPES
jgi:hypothetical protein